MKATPKQERLALSGAWSWAQAREFVRRLRAEVGDAWEWFTPRVREALVAEACLRTVRAHHSTVATGDMDHLLAAMRYAAGLAEWDEVSDWSSYDRRGL